MTLLLTSQGMLKQSLRQKDDRNQQYQQFRQFQDIEWIDDIQCFSVHGNMSINNGCFLTLNNSVLTDNIGNMQIFDD